MFVVLMMIIILERKKLQKYAHLGPGHILTPVAIESSGTGTLKDIFGNAASVMGSLGTEQMEGFFVLLTCTCTSMSICE